jgi:hypothetical protein
MNKKIFRILILFLLALTFHTLGATASLTEETESNVPELTAFHEIIYPIWHTAYPEKDYDMLRSYVPEINRLAQDLDKATLPGILRDKKTKWENGIEELKQVVEEYNKAASGEDNQALLNAAEELHSKFEMLVRIIRPVLKEADEFHKVLYVVYHKHLPNREFDSIKSVADDLVQKAEAITKTTLPKRLESKEEEFFVAAQELYAASKSLAETCQQENEESIEKAIDHLHTKYQNLEKIFD